MNFVARTLGSSELFRRLCNSNCNHFNGGPTRRNPNSPPLPMSYPRKSSSSDVWLFGRNWLALIGCFLSFFFDRLPLLYSVLFLDQLNWFNSIMCCWLVELWAYKNRSLSLSLILGCFRTQQTLRVSVFRSQSLSFSLAVSNSDSKSKAKGTRMERSSETFRCLSPDFQIGNFN